MGLIDYAGKAVTAAVVGFKSGYHGRCPQCGTIAEGERLFCTKCGTRLLNRHRCNSCGTFVKDSEFCPTCGQSVYAPPAKTEETQSSKTTLNSNPLLERAFIFLSDGEFEKANEYCEKALDIDPQCSKVYIAKLMVDLKVKEMNDLFNQSSSDILEGNPNFVKAYKYGDDETRLLLNNYVNTIRNNSPKSKYNKATEIMSTSTTMHDYLEAAKLFKEIKGYLNSDALEAECKELAYTVEYNSGISAMNSATTESEYKSASIFFEHCIGYKDADELFKTCLKKAEEIKKGFDAYLDSYPILKQAELLNKTRTELIKSIAKITNKPKTQELLPASLVALISIFINLLGIFANMTWCIVIGVIGILIGGIGSFIYLIKYINATNTWRKNKAETMKNIREFNDTVEKMRAIPKYTGQIDPERTIIIPEIIKLDF